MTAQTAIEAGLVGGALAVIYGIVLTFWVLAQPAGNERMREIAVAIQEGAMAFLQRQYRTIGIVAIVMAIIILFAPTLGKEAAIGFLIGAILSGAAGFIGMIVSVRANVRTAEAARGGLGPALNVAFRGGSVTGMLVVGLGLLAVSGYYAILLNVNHGDAAVSLNAMVGLAFGCSLISVFARLGGGIYTKAADVGADLVGKVEAGIPEDDPRNPAVIADNVGDNVGDCAGMAADLFETYCVTTVAAMLLGNLLFGATLPGAVTFPLLLGAVSIVASIVGAMFVGVGGVRRAKIMAALYRGMIVAGVLALIVFYFVTHRVFAGATGRQRDRNLPLRGHRHRNNRAHHVHHRVLHRHAVPAGAAHREGFDHRPRDQYHRRSRHLDAGDGLSRARYRRRYPSKLWSFAVFTASPSPSWRCFRWPASSSRSTRSVRSPITPAASPRWPTCRDDVRDVTDPLDAVGNTTKAVTKGYAIGSAALAAIVLFASFLEQLTNHKCPGTPTASCIEGVRNLFAIGNPFVLSGLFIGGLLPYLFASLSMEAVGRAGGAVVEEVRRQFREIPGIMAGTARPNYATTVDIVTRAALHEMIVPALIPVGVPVLVVLLSYFNVLPDDTGAQMMGGILVGSIVTGFFVAISITSGGGAWDNAKKYIEDGNYGGKGSTAHQAAVTGDTVGDPYKDTAGPAINPMIKVLNIVALLLVGFLVH